MVFLTMTASIVEALEKIQSLETLAETADNTVEFATGEAVGEDLKDKSRAGTELKSQDAMGQDDERVIEGGQPLADGEEKKGGSIMSSTEPTLSYPRVGNPITHGQILDLSKHLKKQCLSPSSLDALLRGSRVYVPPPQAKPEPTSEYKALMARLRREEEFRVYNRMINPPPPMQTFSDQFPASSAANAFASNHQTQNSEDNEITYADINRQMTLILNVLVSIVACGGAIWMIARWWPTPARLAISMTGSIVVGIAEVVVYGGYLRRVGEAKGKAKDLQEVKEVVNTWIVGSEDEGSKTDIGEKPVMIQEKRDLNNTKRRKLKADVS